MDALLFYALAALLLISSALMVWLRNPRHAAYALIGAMLVGTGVVAWLKAEFLALALLLALVGGSALLLMGALPLLAQEEALAESPPDEDRSFWAGIVAVLFFVITYRVLATTPWGAEDHSRLALSETERGLDGIRLLGEALRGEYALALLGGVLVVVVAFAVATTLFQREPDA